MDAVADRDIANDARADIAPDILDLVAFGHSHREALQTTPHGTYLNPGYWFGARTFARIDADGPALYRWRSGAAEPLPAARPLAATSSL